MPQFLKSVFWEQCKNVPLRQLSTERAFTVFGYLRGILMEKTPDSLILEVSGVGYEVTVPASSFCALPPVSSVGALYIHTHVRENEIRLFGFASLFDRQVFELLISVTNVGPKMALALLGPMDGIELCDAISQGRTEILVNTPGVGLKTAERLVLELKTKCQKLKARASEYGGSFAAATGVLPLLDVAPEKGAAVKKATANAERRRQVEDLQSALANLGYKEKQVVEVIREQEERIQKGGEFVLEAALRDALKRLSGHLIQG
jgi:Holliday junction DNA helicase RuvA